MKRERDENGSMWESPLHWVQKGKKQETAENINVGRRLALSRKRVADHGYGIGASLYHGAERRLLREPEAASGTCLIIAFLGAFVHGFLSGRA